MFASRWLRSWKGPAALLGMGAVGFALGTWHGKPTAIAAEPTPPAPPAAGQGADYAQRAIAQIYGNVLITREELGEYLIARQGFQKVELLVNRRIIEHAAKQRGIVITDAEVEASLNDDLEMMKIDKATFVKEILKKRGQTLYELKEDIIRPGLMMKRMCEKDVKVDEAELHKVFVAQYGEKVKCRIILWHANEMKLATQMWDKLRSSEAEFLTAASKQFTPSLASVAGDIDPIGHGASASEETSVIEKIAFRLKPGDVSEIFPIKEMNAIAVLRCEKRVPPVEGVTYEKARDELYKRAYEQKLSRAIPVMFAKLKEEAKPEIWIPHGTTNPTVIRNQQEEDKYLKEDSAKTAPLPDKK